MIEDLLIFLLFSRLSCFFVPLFSFIPSFSSIWRWFNVFIYNFSFFTFKMLYAFFFSLFAWLSIRYNLSKSFQQMIFRGIIFRFSSISPSKFIIFVGPFSWSSCMSAEQSMLCLLFPKWDGIFVEIAHFSHILLFFGAVFCVCYRFRFTIIFGFECFLYILYPEFLFCWMSSLLSQFCLLLLLLPLLLLLLAFVCTFSSALPFCYIMSCLSLSFISLNGSMVSRSKAFVEMEMFHCIRHLMFQNIAYMPFTMTIVNLPCGTDFIRYISYFPF